MEKEFEEEFQHDSERAWYGYTQQFQTNCYFIFRHRKKYQRSVRCKKCGAKIPKEVPRIFISGSWYYYTGHYCLHCAAEKIREDIIKKEYEKKEIEQNLQDLKNLLAIVEHTKGKEAYKNYMSLGVLCAKIEPSRDKRWRS